jgi:hypothetical protein
MQLNDTKRCSCGCHDAPLLVLEGKQAVALVVLLIVSCAVLFATGYMVGKKVALDTFTQEMSEQSFADRLHHSMTMLYGAGSAPSEKESNDAHAATDQVSHEAEKEPSVTIPAAHYCAQLARLSNAGAAQQLVDRLQKRGIKTTIVKRINTYKTRDGKTVKTPWYAVSTAQYPTQHEVEALVSSIKLTENLTKVRIIKV